MKTPYRMALLLALSGASTPLFAYYRVVERTANLEIAPGIVKTVKIIGDETNGQISYTRTVDQSLITDESRQFLSATITLDAPSRRGEFSQLKAEVNAHVSGTAPTNIHQTINYEVVFDVFLASRLIVTNPSAVSFERIASNNSRLLIPLPTTLPDAPHEPYPNELPVVMPGRYAITQKLLLAPPDSALGDGKWAGDYASFYLYEAPELAVPEPTSWALIGGGLFSVAAVRRRQRKPAH